MTPRWDDEEYRPVRGRDFTLALLFLLLLFGSMWLAAALGTWLTGSSA